MNIIQDLQNKISIKYPAIKLFELAPSKVIFEESTKLSCFYCAKYNRNWRCPPNLPQTIDFKKTFTECQNGMLVLLEIPFNETNYQDIRNNSSVQIHKAILDIEKLLWEHNIAPAISFIGGSCKLCKNGCSKDKCANPGESRSPFESTGVNVIKTAALLGISVIFPPRDTLKRIGFVMW